MTIPKNDKDKVISLSILDNTQIAPKTISKDKKIKGSDEMYQFTKILMLAQRNNDFPDAKTKSSDPSL